ncbi:MAG: hypothetical protein KBD76_16515 [Bacteriovorax sp.]|nr:hypothetical protein [Bacteriovorax sp.]
MSSKTIFLVIFCALVSRLGLAQEVNRVTLNVHYSAPIDLSNDKNIIELLKTEGISLDDNSTIFIHEEKNAIDLTCFDCVVRSIGAEVAYTHSYNEIGGGGLK